MSQVEHKLSQRLQSIVRRRQNEPSECHLNPLSEKDRRSVFRASDKLSEEVAQFASHGTHGIVDLAASMSVMGETRFQELCRALPSHILHARKESPCSVSFRFGNNSTVLGKRAIYFPVDKKLITVTAVPSQTPFLIANSVFQNLGAVIDTAKGEVLFQEIGRCVPMELLKRELFQIDLLDLLKTSSSP